MDLGLKQHLNHIQRFFQIRHIYTRTEYCTHEGGNFKGIEPIYTIYEAKQEAEYPGIIIIDTTHLITPSEDQISLNFYQSRDELAQYIQFISPIAKNELEKILAENGFYVPSGKEREGWDLSAELYKSKLCFKPVKKLRNPDYVTTMDWGFFIERIIRWDSEEKDPRLNLIHKTQLLKGIEPRANAHTLICLNAGTGKSIHFKIHGINYDKVTKNAFLGFAKSPKEIFKGTVDGTELPIGIDQIEVGNWGIMDFMFNIMEYGESRVSSGGVDFPIKSKSPISLIANPLGNSLDPERGFSSILGHLTNNPAIGRRFSVIAYSQDYNIITTKSTQQSMDAWQECSVFFRAVEEYVKEELIKLYQSPKLWEWLNVEIPGYKENIFEIVGDSNDETIKTFLLEHANAGQSRVRSAAFSASLVDHLKDILMVQYNTENIVTIDEIIQHAEETILPDLIRINIESANNIVQTILDEKKLLVNAYLKAQPDYLREIIYAVEYAKQNGIADQVFMLSTIDYTPETSTYQNMRQCMRKLLQRKKGVSEFNANTLNYFGFVFEPYGENDIKISITDSTLSPYITMPKVPNMPKVPKEENFENQKLESSKSALWALSAPEKTTKQKMDELYEFMGPKIGYYPRSLCEYFGFTLKECIGYLEALERAGQVYLRIDKWYKVEDVEDEVYFIKIG